MLIDVRREGDAMRLLSSGGDSRLERYHPYFYAISDDPEEKMDIISRHPLVLDAELEERFLSLWSREKEPCVKVKACMSGFKKVVRDMGKVHGIKELAETTIPHHLRFVMDSGLSFFDGDDELRLAAIGPRDPIPQCDVLFTFGGDRFLRGRSGVLANRLGCFLPRCVHIDLITDMKHDIYNESCGRDILGLGRERLVRIMELSRMTGVKPDLVSRVTPGKLNTFLHIRAARKRGYIVPDRKRSMERPKSLRLLQAMDKGGTIFYPRPGIYHNVAKCDFASMYPNIIVKHNISPEAMHCTCGDDDIVPQAGWRICRKRGVIPDGIEAVLKRRLELKRLKRETGKKEYDIRQRALKNILVTCFGYLGFKNFVFSNVETKECVMLYGRHILERTKLIAESMGLDVVYGIVDSVFVKNGTMEEYREFVQRVSREFGIELELDCVFRAIAFPAAHDGSGIANKYYGMTYDGEIEARGIAYRHSDAPAFIKRFQEEAIRATFGSGSLEDVHGRYREAIMQGRFSLEELAITRSIRRSAYKVEAAHVIAHRQDPRGGHVTYVHTHYGPRPLRFAKKDEIDRREYLRLLEMKRDELVSGL